MHPAGAEAEAAAEAEQAEKTQLQNELPLHLLEPKHMEAKKAERRFFVLAKMEGISYLLLLFVAMPLKYMAGIPEAVKYTGWAHGVLFVAFCAFLPYLWLETGWKFLRTLRAFALSLIPFGTFAKL